MKARSFNAATPAMPGDRPEEKRLSQSLPGAAAPPLPAVPTSCDVLVVGGGINGAGIARDLAGRGLKVVLCEQDDLARHTSSSSTKLIHGGLRYLEYYEFGLCARRWPSVSGCSKAPRTSCGRCGL